MLSTLIAYFWAGWGFLKVTKLVNNLGGVVRELYRVAHHACSMTSSAQTSNIRDSLLEYTGYYKYGIICFTSMTLTYTSYDIYLDIKIKYVYKYIKEEQILAI